MRIVSGADTFHTCGMIDAGPHIDWILSSGRKLGLQGLVDVLGPQLQAGGVPVIRIRLGMRTIHPLIGAFSVIWEDGDVAQNMLTYGHVTRTSDAYIGSPIQQINDSSEPVRHRLTGPLDPDAHSTLHTAKSNGGTDYYGMRLDFALGDNAILIFVGNGPGGFTDDQIAVLDAIAGTLAPVVEVYAQNHLATAIATSYLGQRTGQRVLDGQITRGDVESIEAAILFSDIRGWTALNATHSAAETIEIANRYFEVISDAVDNNGGEILKFMGDGVLALFPADDDPQDACRRAVAASHAALGIAAVAELPVTFGIGIHFGEVMYGNIGARARIDFTILGQAVNTAARVEACCGRLGQSVLVSQVVADATGQNMKLIATETLKGIATPMALFAPANS